VNEVTRPVKRSADDDGDRQIDDVAAREKLLEALQHERILPWG